MPSVSRTETMPFTAQQMYDLVCDVERYNEFLPWCSGARIDRQTADGVEATLTLSKGPIHQSFSTRNRHVENEAVEIGLLRGPFRHLQGVWRFADEPNGCRVSLDMEFEFSNRVLAKAMSKVFEVATSTMVDAFRQRAIALYGYPA